MSSRKQLGTGQYSILVLGLLFIFLGGCSDPYAAKLPTSARLTPGEIEKITEKLEPSDKNLFRRWAERRARGGEYGGEGSALTVKIALLNQVTFDDQQQSELEAAKAQKALDEKIALQKEEDARQQRAKLDQMASKRREVDAEIRKYFTAQAIGYEWRPLFNSNGVEFARQWAFKLKLTNRSAKDITGAAGWATVSDVFNADLGSYPLRIEPRIKPGQTIDFLVVMDYDRKNPKHVEMTQTQSLRVNWFFESVAFIDGTNVDYQAIVASTPLSIPAKVNAHKPAAL